MCYSATDFLFLYSLVNVYKVCIYVLYIYICMSLIYLFKTSVELYNCFDTNSFLISLAHR